MNYRVGIDIGGTFTDFALLKGSEVILHKNLSTPEDRSVGVMEGLGKLAEKEGHSLTDFLGKCDAIVHGTTIADNTLIEMNGAVTGLITTEGFRDEIEYRRGFKEDIWDVRLANVRKYAENYQSMTDGVADQLVASALDNEQQLTALKKKYHAQFKAALGAKPAARWLQAETTVGTLAMLQLLSEVPLLR